MDFDGTKKADGLTELSDIKVDPIEMVIGQPDWLDQFNPARKFYLPFIIFIFNLCGTVLFYEDDIF